MKIESDELKKVNSDKMFQHMEDTAVLKLRDQLQRQLDWKKKKKKTPFAKTEDRKNEKQ